MKHTLHVEPAHAGTHGSDCYRAELSGTGRESDADGEAAHRSEVLRRFGARAQDLSGLLAYTENPFDLSGPLILEDEPFVFAWERYLAEAHTHGLFPVLQQALIQLRFPIREGMSQDAAYCAATRRGDRSGLGPSGLLDGGLRLAAPETIRLELHPTPAGRIPVITAPERKDFEALVQAVTRRNEPALLPASMGALMVSGYNNWSRISEYRTTWAASSSGAGSWAEAMQRLIPQKALYQDRFIILSEGPYSDVPASELDLDEVEWLRLSHAIRKEHESAHYYCKRALGAMRYHLFDEVIADTYGLSVAIGEYRPAWLLRFLGLDGDHPEPDSSGRMWNYCEGLSADSVRVLAALLRKWAKRSPGTSPSSLADRAMLIRELAKRGLAA